MEVYGPCKIVFFCLVNPSNNLVKLFHTKYLMLFFEKIIQNRSKNITGFVFLFRLARNCITNQLFLAQYFFLIEWRNSLGSVIETTMLRRLSEIFPEASKTGANLNGLLTYGHYILRLFLLNRWNMKWKWLSCAFFRTFFKYFNATCKIFGSVPAIF